MLINLIISINTNINLVNIMSLYWQNTGVLRERNESFRKKNPSTTSSLFDTDSEKTPVISIADKSASRLTNNKKNSWKI